MVSKLLKLCFVLFFCFHRRVGPTARRLNFLLLLLLLLLSFVSIGWPSKSIAQFFVFFVFFFLETIDGTARSDPGTGFVFIYLFIYLFMCCFDLIDCVDFIFQRWFEKWRPEGRKWLGPSIGIKLGIGREKERERKRGTIEIELAPEVGCYFRSIELKERKEMMKGGGNLGWCQRRSERLTGRRRRRRRRRMLFISTVNDIKASKKRSDPVPPPPPPPLPPPIPFKQRENKSNRWLNR